MLTHLRSRISKIFDTVSYSLFSFSSYEMVYDRQQVFDGDCGDINHLYFSSVNCRPGYFGSRTPFLFFD
jgi:hypothetical protein